ncbi:MAG TPA: acyl-CoA dehydrogenase family protein, partial [Kofleriaceae bacterium]
MTPRVHELCRWLRDYAGTRLNSNLMDERRSMPPYVVMDLGNRGLLGASAPASYGGLELSAPEILAVFEQLGAIDLTLAIFLGIHNALGIRPIARFGSEPLKTELLPQLAAGRILGAFAMTEPAAGSNVRGIEATATRDGDSWRVRGEKLWVGNGSWAGAINVFARRPPGEGGGMSGFTVRAGTPGLRMGAEALTAGMRAIVQNQLALD